ncbi:MAG: rhomboid family intramembrane serine protease [Blastocatellia bacterium]|nr:rhomboid family intramembrane serine protease [Blastocatellia bacterium]
MPTPSHLPQCVNCGAISLHAVVADEEARAHHRFERAFFSRATPVTYVLLGLNILAFVAMLAVMPGMNDPEVIIAFGAKTNELLRGGDWFRLVTPIFIHGGAIHLLSNSYALWNVGPQVEKLYGSARYLFIYLVAGVGGVVGSYIGQELTHKPNVPSVGASGAIFGLFGVLAAFGYKYRRELPDNFRQAFGAGVLPVIAINLFIGLTIPFIDNGAHIGGLLTGILLTLLIPYIAPGKERVSRVGLVVLALCALVVAASFAGAWRKSGEHLSWSQKAVAGYLDGINAAERVINRGLRAAAGSEATAREAGEAMVLLDNAQPPDPRAAGIVRDLRDLLMRLRAPGADLDAIRRDHDAVADRLDNWVKEVGKQHGIGPTEEKSEK